MMTLDFEELDNRNLEFILGKFKPPILAVYRTGSTINGGSTDNSDIDYLIITGHDTHSMSKNYNAVKDRTRNLIFDYIEHTKKDLESPTTFEKDCKEGKIMYLLREKGRNRKLLYGKDIFLEFLNRKELEKIAFELGIDSNSMNRFKKSIKDCC